MPLNSVLKKRELRLKREQSGLKSLVSGLVGGPALLREWEKEWKEKFGGEERDEIEADDMDDGGSDDEDGDDEDNDLGDGGRKRKKAKVADKPVKKEAVAKEKKSVANAPVVLAGDGTVVPEKRKRGRPRKVVPAPVQPVVVEPQPQESQPQAPHQQYLLATFALFSFFNSPLTSSYQTPAYPSHSHTGTVLSYHDSPAQTSWGWREGVQGFHLVVSFLVLVSIVLPWLPVRKGKGLFSFLSSYQVRATAAASTSPVSSVTVAPSQPRPSLASALTFTKRGTQGEATGLRDALGGAGGLGMVKMVRKSLLWSRGKDSFEQKGLEQRAWVRLGELCVLGGKIYVLLPLLH